MSSPVIFSRDLDNDLQKLSNALVEISEKIAKAEIFGISNQDILDMPDVVNSPSSYFGKRYNLFSLNIDGLDKLKSALVEMTQEALVEYNSDKKVNEYVITSWFNLHKVSGKQPFHDHFAGDEANPVFHGYYCVNAEPSLTHYLIEGNELDPMDITNKNNRAILLKNGHPHGIGNWPYDDYRITIAYDIVPLELASKDREWISLSV